MTKVDTPLIPGSLIIWSVLFSVLSVPYIDVLSRGGAGVVLSAVLFAVVLLLAFTRMHLAMMAVLILQIVIPAYPRDVIDAYEALQITKTVSYNTICSLSVAKLSLIQHLTFEVAGLALFRLVMARRELYVGKVFKICLTALFASTLIGTLYFNFTQGEDPNFREIITNIRLPLFLGCGIIYFNYLYHYKGIAETVLLLNRTLIAITIIMGVRVPLFLLSGIKQKIPSLDLGVVPHIPIAVVLAIFFLLEHDRRHWRTYLTVLALSLFALLSPSRGHMAILVMSIGMFLVACNFSIRYLKYIVMISLMFIIPVAFVLLTNERLFNFILWKLTFFTGNISDSGRVRVFEYKNILAEALNNPPFFLFGKGLTGYFSFVENPLPAGIVLDLKSFTQQEISTGKFYHPHFFINFIALKYGVIGLSLYVTMIYVYFKSSMKCKVASFNASSHEFIFISLLSVIISASMVFEMFFRNYYALYFAITLPLLVQLSATKDLPNEGIIPVT